MYVYLCLRECVQDDLTEIAVDFLGGMRILFVGTAGVYLERKVLCFVHILNSLRFQVVIAVVL